jgi:ribonuclease T2
MKGHRKAGDAYRGAGVVALAAFLVFSTVAGANAAGRDIGARAPGRFDYYVLSLSWVPGFCATHRGHADECGRGLGFALHGLWPQMNGGDYPTDCSPDALPPLEIQRYAPLYAAPSLIAHEWPKHGTCSGLTPRDYFGLSARGLRRLRIPADYRSGASSLSPDPRGVTGAFTAANPGLPSDGLRIVTSHGVLTGLDVCLTKSGDFRAC